MTTVSSRALALLLGAWRAGTNAPAYRALADRIRLLALDGRLTLGQRLPAERELAAQLGLSRTTVSAAYADLRESGHVESLRGSGSVIRLPSGAKVDEPPLENDLLDLGKAVLPALPVVAELAAEAAAELGAFLGESGFDPLGTRLARQAIAERYTARGLPTRAEQIMVTLGSQHAIALIARVLLARGDRVLVETPSYPHALDTLRAAGGRPIAVPVSARDGWDHAALEQGFLRGTPTLAYVMPDNHNPTGASMSEDERERLVRLAERSGTTLLVDETIGELHLDGRPAPRPVGVHGEVITIGSLGKTLWGGLRIGWIRAERPVIERLARQRFSYDLGTPILEQLVVARVMPRMDEMLQLRRDYLRTSRDHLLARLARDFPDWELPREPGGIAAWVGLGAPVSSTLALLAREHGVAIAAGPRFGLDGAQFERWMRIPFTHPPGELDRGIDALAAAWHDVARDRTRPAERELAQVV